MPLEGSFEIVISSFFCTGPPLSEKALNLKFSNTNETLGHNDLNIVGKKNHIFTKSCHCQDHGHTYPNNEQSPQRSQNSDIQSHFSVLQIG